MTMKMAAAASVILAGWAALALPAGAQVGDGSPTLGRAYQGVNDTIIRCPAVTPRSAEQLAAQFETRPRDLDEMSKMAQKFMDPASDFAPAVAFRRRQAEQRESDWAYLCRYRDDNEKLRQSAKRPKVVFMGDSITEGWIEARPEFFAANDYVDRGISGQSSTQMVTRFYADVISLRPQAVHIVAGTNDIGGATGAITADEYMFNINAMIDLAQANGVKVVLGAIPPMSRLLPRPQFDVRPVVRDLNDRLAALARKRGLVFVDYYAPLAAPDGSFDARFANDGVHPTRAGYAVMEPLARAAIDQALSR